MLSTIGLIIDIVIVAALAICGIIGFKKGFLKSLISLFSWAVCIGVAIFAAKYVASWINGIYDMTGFIGDKIANGLNGIDEVFAKPVSAFASTDAIISELEAVNMNGLLFQLVKVVFSSSKITDTSTIDGTISSYVGESLGHICMLIISAILIFIVLRIVIALLSRLFDNIARTKILGGLNKILGVVFGVIKAGCVIVIFNVILVALSLIPAVNNAITPLVQDNTKVERFIYNKTDEIVEKYVIEGDALEDWISNLWNSR